MKKLAITLTLIGVTLAGLGLLFVYRLADLFVAILSLPFRL
jgi:hypothetical protein